MPIRIRAFISASLAFVVPATEVAAQQIMSLGPRPEVARSAEIKIHAVDVALLQAVLNNAPISARERSEAIIDLSKELRDGTSKSELIDLLVKYKVGDAGQARIATEIILERLGQSADGSEFLSSTSASARSDEIYANLEILRIANGNFNVYVRTANAISRAEPDTILTPTQLDTFRSQAASAIHASYSRSGGPSARNTVDWGLIVTGARAGTYQSGSRYLFGTEGALKYTLRTAMTVKQPESSSASISLRVAYRGGTDIVEIEGVDRLGFAQVVVELLTPHTKIPVGFAFTRELATPAVSKQVRRIQIFGTVGQ
jgi:hypothetical protein